MVMFDLDAWAAPPRKQAEVRRRHGIVEQH
jgi:hypothetical protein